MMKLFRCLVACRRVLLFILFYASFLHKIFKDICMFAKASADVANINTNHTTTITTHRQLMSSMTQPLDNVAICALFMNEDATLTEWIEYHLMIGVSKIFLYHLDNHADKNRWRHVLWPYVSKGQVQIHAQSLTYLGQWSFRQVASLQHCYDTYRNDFQWLAFIDVDEFIVPRNARVSLPSLLRLYSGESGLVIPWRTFGPVVTFNQSRGSFPRITEATNATLFDYRKGQTGRLSGTVKIIVNTRHEVADHCYFGQDGLDDYVHNCLFRSPSPPVEERFRSLNDSRYISFAASNKIVQLNHYLARTCNHFFGEKRATRIANLRAQYGKFIPKWYKFRLGIGLGNTTEESCRYVQKVFSTPDTSIVELGRKLWAKLDSENSSLLLSNPLPDRSSCDHCLPEATCVDLLQRSGSKSKAECVCPQPMIGDGRTFCGNVTWPANVLTPTNGNFSYLLSPPNPNPYASDWTTYPHSKEYSVYFGSNSARFTHVRMILIYQPFSPTQITTLSYKLASRKHIKISTGVDLRSVQQFGKKNSRFMMIPVGDATLTSLLIRFDVPILLGGIGIVTSSSN